MCGRFNVTVPAEQLAELFGAPDPPPGPRGRLLPDGAAAQDW